MADGNQLQLTSKGKVFFQVRQGSNYKVIMTYEREEVIEFEQFQKLADAIFNGNGDFITINERILQKKDIRMIEPTYELTAKQMQASQIKTDNELAEQKHKNAEIEEYTKFRANYLDKKFGKGGWNLKSVMLDAKLTKEIQDSWNSNKKALT